MYIVKQVRLKISKYSLRITVSKFSSKKNAREYSKDTLYEAASLYVSTVDVHWVKKIMLKGFRSRSKRDSKRSKDNLDTNNSEFNVDEDTTSPKLKHDLKEEWRLSGLSADVSEFAGRLLDHLVKGPDDTTQVRGKIHTAYQKTMEEMLMDPRCQPQIGGTMEPLEHSRRDAGEEEDEHESTQGSEAEHEEGSYCAQADEDDSDEQHMQPTIVREESEL